MIKNFLIRSIDIQNFRGYKTLSEPFKFITSSNSVARLILLSGPNGYGKTSMMDAIEWCLTGSVERLRREFLVRTDGNERKQPGAHKGLLRNRSSSEDSEVRVSIEGVYQGTDILISRSYKGKKELEGFNLSLPLIECSDQEIKKIFNNQLKLIINNFYDRFICSYEKNLQMYKFGREETYKIFSCFFGEPRQAEKIVSNLQVIEAKYLEELDGATRQKSNMIYNKTILENKEKSIKDSTGYNNRLMEYPTIKLFSGEIQPYYLDISDLDDDNKKEEKIKYIKYQKQILQNIFLVYRSREINKYVEYINRKNKYDFLSNELTKLLTENQAIIEKAQNKDYSMLGRCKNDILSFRLQCLKLNNISELNDFTAKLEKYKIGGISDKDIYLLSSEQIYNIQKNKDLIIEKEYRIKNLRAKVEEYGSDSPWVKALRTLVDNVNGFQEYRQQGHDKCPLCGSQEVFKTSIIAEQAKSVLGETDKARRFLVSQIDEVNSTIKSILEQLKTAVINILDDRTQEINSYLSAIQATKGIQVECMKYELDFNILSNYYVLACSQKIKKELEPLGDLSNKEIEILDLLENGDGYLEYIESFLNKDYSATKGEFLSMSREQKIRSLINVIEHDKSKIDVTSKLLNLSIELLEKSDIQKRIEILSLLLNSVEKRETKRECTELTNKIKELDEYEAKLNKYMARVKNTIENIKIKIRENEQQQIFNIIEPLDKIYRRITRNTNIRGISLKRNDTKSAYAELKVLDRLGNVSPYGNVFSTGQLSTLAVSIFFATAMAHRNQDIRCYFMDDPIQTMDDLNVLSFVDLLRVELSNKLIERNEGFLDQLFISTCDEDLDNLIVHKMKNFDVDYCKIQFEGFEKYKLINV